MAAQGAGGDEGAQRPVWRHIDIVYTLKGYGNMNPISGGSELAEATLLSSAGFSRLFAKIEFTRTQSRVICFEDNGHEYLR